MYMSESKNAEYRVLARKYRPQNFEELIGQDALVRTLKNAIESGRIAHAFMLTGVRGVGKTTTARIIAKALNYTGADGTSGPTTGDTGDCDLCKSISEDRHPDVIEMDAATRTGIDDIREILDGVRYAPTEARYKIYIIDEVHMLSKQAFNALLKTLEEPPAHVKFIFATTEIRKVPITVLSRCQRFDLRRVDVPTLSAHFAGICEKENVKAEDEAVGLISRAADGSVRDGLSLLDQAMALGGEEITAQQVQDMLGLADRARGLDILEHALTGNMPEALNVMEELYRAGADPVTFVQDLLELTHILTKFRAVPETRDQSHAMAADQIDRAVQLASELSMPTLGKTWQILLKGLSEVQIAPNPQSAAEMVLIRLAYAADLPDPSDLIKKLKDGDSISSSSSSGGASSSGSSKETVNASAGAQVAKTALSSSSAVITKQSNANASPQSPSPSIPPPPQASHYVKSNVGAEVELSVVETMPMVEADMPQPEMPKNIQSLEDVVQVLETGNAVLLASQVHQFVHLVKLTEGRLEFCPSSEAPPKLAQDLGKAMKDITGERWVVSVSSSLGAPTLAEKSIAVEQAEFDTVKQLPIIQDILQVFPEAELTAINPRQIKKGMAQ